jgi:acetyltransferase-like isoleucine patch superfamily enzyme
MVEIGGVRAMVGYLLLTLILVLSVGTTVLVDRFPLGDFRGVTLVIAGVVLSYVYALIVYRIFLALVPLEVGELKPDSSGAFAAQVSILFYVAFFNTLIRTHFIPLPLLRLLYLALGARLGKGTYSAGVILDPPLVTVGDNSMIGHDAVIFAHVIEAGKNYSLFKTRIGNNVTIGTLAIIMPDVEIGDEAIVAAGSVVTKGTRIGPREIWGGIPARLIQTLTD